MSDTGENPDIEKPVPVAVAFETLNAVLPVFVIVTARVAVVPTGILPKSKLVGETEIVVFDPAPVPESAIVETDGFVFAVIEMLPATAPAVVGANLAINEVPWPGFTVIGSVNPLTEKPVPEAASCVMVSVADPVFVTVNVCVTDVPVATLPNVPVAPATATVVAFVGSVVLALVRPVHPTCVRLASNATANVMKIKGLWRLKRVRWSRKFAAGTA